MKWNILVASMVLGLGLSTPSFGDLLDRMLGSNGCGCEQKDGCAQKCGDPKCDGKDACAQKDGCCQKECGPKCARRGLLNLGCAQKDGGKDGCGQKDGCKDPCQKDGCGQKDGCKDGCAQKCGGLFGGGLLGGCAQKDGCGGKDGCKDPCQKDGCKDPCAQKGCTQKSGGPSLLERIFACRRDACGESKCGKDGKCGDKGDDKVPEAEKAPATADAPVPPAPVVDPSAFLKSQRRVITASTSLVR
jgi:hypothetical protein